MTLWSPINLDRQKYFVVWVSTLGAVLEVFCNTLYSILRRSNSFQDNMVVMLLGQQVDSYSPFRDKNTFIQFLLVFTSSSPSDPQLLLLLFKTCMRNLTCFSYLFLHWYTNLSSPDILFFFLIPTYFFIPLSPSSFYPFPFPFNVPLSTFFTLICFTSVLFLIPYRVPV